MEQPTIIVLMTVPCSLECSFAFKWMSGFACVISSWSTEKNRDGSICNDDNAMDNTGISPIVYAVATPSAEHPLLQLKRSLPAVNHGPGRLTDLMWLLLYAHLSRGFSCFYSGIFSCTEEKWVRKVKALLTHSRRIKDSLLRNAPWEEAGSMSEKT